MTRGTLVPEQVAMTTDAGIQISRQLLRGRGTARRRRPLPAEFGEVRVKSALGTTESEGPSGPLRSVVGGGN